MQVLLSMKNIDKSFDAVKALDHAEMEVYQGEIHALIGANGAGKSTLMKVLCGELEADDGEIVFEGEPFFPQSGAELYSAGVFMLHQELKVIPVLSVAQYLYLGREPHKKFFIDDKKMNEDAEKLLQPIDPAIKPTMLMSELSIAQRQMVEIAKAISFQLKLLILDEPTTALGEKETAKIFEIINELKAHGISVIYISHRLPELFAISDRITVMRDGRYITTLQTKETESSELIRLLAGRELEKGKKRKAAVEADAETVLEVNGLSTAALLQDISFSLKKGEILGLGGLSGAGRSETARAICGIDPMLEGEIILNGTPVRINSPANASEAGICYLSEDRNNEGVLYGRSILENTLLSSLDNYQKGIFLNEKKMLADAIEYNARLNTKYADAYEPVSSLSGGNVQKTIIARWLIKNPQIFIFDEPTKGIDVGSKDEIYQIIADIAKDGHSVIIISSETDELLDNCDRIVVLCEGRVSGEMKADEFSKEKLMYYSTGGELDEDER